MAKVSELSDKELDSLIVKHEKTLQLLLKEKGRRTGKSITVKLNNQPKSTPENPSGQMQFVIDEEAIAKNEVVQDSGAAQDGTANMRLTRVLKLSKDELEKFNKAVEKNLKKKKS